MAKPEQLYCPAATVTLASSASVCYSVLGYAKARSCGLRTANAVRMITDAAGCDEHNLRGTGSRGWHALGMGRLDVV
jgi:hypothetical protein